MASGWKRMFINAQERAVSADINRLQTFKERDVAEAFRYMMDVIAGSDDTVPTISEPNTVEAPLRAEIINGLMVRPQAGSLNLLVDPGSVFVMNPDGAADESNYKYISDVGVTVLGALVLTANPAGSARIDVIECRINPIESIITAPRDIFNPTTGLFTATAVTKERTGRLEYRVRAGVAGAGFPGTVLGWLPIAVASLPAAAVNVDTVTFWDVRPLISDRQFAPFNVVQGISDHVRMNAIADTTLAFGECRLSGNYKGCYAGRRAGGQLRSGSGIVDPGSTFLDLRNVANHSAGFVFPAAGLFYLYLLFPFGLPQWARYDAFPNSRIPRSPKGIPAVSTVLPNAVFGDASGPVGLPTATGLGTSTLSATCIYAGRTSGAVPTGSFTKGFRHLSNSPPTIVGVHAGSVVTFTLTEGTDFPANARSLIVSGKVGVDVAAGAVVQITNHIEVDRVAGGQAVPALLNDRVAYANPTGGLITFTVGMPGTTIPIGDEYPLAAPAGPRVIRWTIGAGLTTSAPELYVLGWEYGP